MCFFFPVFSLLVFPVFSVFADKHTFERIRYCNKHFNKKLLSKCPSTAISINDRHGPSHLAKHKHIWKSDLFFLNALKFHRLQFSTHSPLWAVLSEPCCLQLLSPRLRYLLSRLIPLPWAKLLLETAVQLTEAQLRRRGFVAFLGSPRPLWWVACKGTRSHPWTLFPKEPH